MRTFEIIPALDLAGGRVVRLVQGQFAAETSYGDDPVALATGFWRDGATTVHVIDLDAARTGERPAAHVDVIAEILARRPDGGLVQVGGGLRDEAAVDAALALGVDRALIGTLAFRDPPALDRLVARHGDRICVTADTLEGSVRVAGWQEDSGVDVVAAVRELAGRGVGAFLVTAIERDGTLAGPDLRLLAAVRQATDVLLLASGGIGSIDDLRAVREVGADGVVVGRALLAGAFTLPEALGQL
jgi:phosphoribosylformimino-5-aminoimidazole carboxamide ribotide isomerase